MGNDLEVLKNKILMDSYAQGHAKRANILVGLQWIMTPDENDFIGAVTQRFTAEYQSKANRYGCQSLACFGEVASAISFEQFFPQLHGLYERTNILMLDYADRQGTMAFVLKINR